MSGKQIPQCLGIGLVVSMLYPSSLIALDKVSVGLSAVSAIFGIAWVTEDRGIFKKHGIDSQVIVIGGGAARGVSSLIAGDVQFLLGAGDAAINANLRGADVVITASVLNKGVQRVMARSELRRPEDLIGKNIGITRFGSAAHLVLLMMLNHWGMSAGQIQMIQVGTSPAMVVSLDKGGIDAAVLTIPSVFVAEDRGYRVLADLDEMDIYYLNTMLDTTRGYLRTHRDQATRFIKAFIEGIAYFKTHRAESIKIIKEKYQAEGELDEETATHLYEDLKMILQPKPYATIPAISNVYEISIEQDKAAEKTDPMALWDFHYLRRIDDSGFIDNLYRL